MAEPQQILDDLRGLFRGRLQFDEPTRILYASDASPFQIAPLGVAVPRDEADLITLVKYANESNIELVPRGAGTGLAGESLGPGIVVDLSIHFQSILRIDADRVVAQPGVVHAKLNEELAKHGRRFAPDPASSKTCTIGGMVATNASGGNVVRYGYTRDHVLGLRAVWDTGDADTLGDFTGPPPTDRLVELRSQTAALLAEYRELIATTRPQTRFNRCGYVLSDVLTASGLDLTKLLVGSEGTLGFLTEAVLSTQPLPGGNSFAVLGFPSVDAAVRGGLALKPVDGIVSCDLLDQRLVAFARASGPVTAGVVIPPAVGAALVLSFEADTEALAERYAHAAVDSLRFGHRLLVLIQPGCQPETADRVRRFRESAVGGLYAIGHGPRPIAGMEDVAVPAEDLARFLTDIQKILRRFDLSTSMLCHVLAGQVHVRPFVDLASPENRDKLWPAAEAIHTRAIALGGTISTQHGTGLARTPWVEKQYGPLIPAFRDLKRIFDPKGILNPGKIVGPDPRRPAWPLRPLADNSTPRTSLLVWTHAEPGLTAATCNGCGDCRSRSRGERMCPVFRATNDEAASPRAKANLLRQMLEPGSDPSAASVRAVADLCVNCKMCRDECQARVDIPKLMLEAKARHHAEHGLDRTDWILARAEGLSAFAGNFAFTANVLLGSRPARWAIEYFLGISRHRTLPMFTHRTFLRRARKAGLFRKPPGKPGKRIAYFVDSFANFNDPLIGLATVAVLEHHGYSVHVPRRQRGCGMASLAQGDVETARDVAALNVRTLADLVRDGFTVVCSEPTAALALTQDYLDILEDPDAKLVADNTVELTAFLGELRRNGELKTGFTPLPATVGHHIPCHIKALREPAQGPALLDLIPELKVRTLDVGCSGMAGTWGLRTDTYQSSLTAGKPMLDEFDRPGILLGSTECSACRMQMQTVGKRTLHPVQYLAFAYGLLPQLAPRLNKPLGRLITD